MSLLLEFSYYVLKIFRHSILVVLDFDELVVGFKNLLAGTVTTKRHRAKRRLIAMSGKVCSFYGSRNYCILLYSLSGAKHNMGI